MGNGPAENPRFSHGTPQPLPIIGVRRLTMQSRAHDDDDRAAPAVPLGPEIPMPSAFQPPAPGKVFFEGGRGVAGFVDSEPKTLVPSASNRSTPEWTGVDSRQGRFDEKQLR